MSLLRSNSDIVQESSSMLGLTPPQSHGPVGILVRTHSVKVCTALISVPLQDALNKFSSYYNL